MTQVTSKASKEAFQQLPEWEMPARLRIEKLLEVFGPAGLYYIRKTCGLKVQSASARLSEMHDDGIVELLDDGRYALVPRADRLAVRDARRMERYRRWKANGDKEEFFYLYHMEKLESKET